MKCPACRCVFLRALSRSDPEYCKVPGPAVFCPRCGQIMTPDEAGVVRGVSLADGYGRFVAQVAEDVNLGNQPREPDHLQSETCWCNPSVERLPGGWLHVMHRTRAEAS